MQPATQNKNNKFNKCRLNYTVHKTMRTKNCFDAILSLQFTMHPL